MNQETNPTDLPTLVDQNTIGVAPPTTQTQELGMISDLSEIPPPQEIRTKRHFTYEEDNQIKALVEQHGTNQWALIAKSLVNRTARQVRDRWRCYLQPGVTKAEWTIEEDKTLIHLVHTTGKIWAQLVKFFPGRTDVDLKNHWNKLQRHAKKIQSGTPLLDPPELTPITTTDITEVPQAAPELQPPDLQDPKAEPPGPQ